MVRNINWNSLKDNRIANNIYNFCKKKTSFDDKKNRYIFDEKTGGKRKKKQGCHSAFSKLLLEKIK